MKKYVKINPNYSPEERQIIHVFGHKNMVNYYLSLITCDMLKRGSIHDDSKLYGKEKEQFINVSDPKYTSLKYGTKEYNEAITNNVKLAQRTHYESNDHHPEHHENGIDDMDLVQILEMLVDWKVGGLAMDAGDIFKSIEINKNRFGIDDQLTKILINTANKYFKEED